MPLLFSLVYSPTACHNCSPFLFRVHVGRGSSLLSGGACHTLTAVGCLLLSKHTGGGGATPAFSSPLVYLQFVWGGAPPPLSGAQGAPPSLLCVLFFQLLIYYSVCFFLFSLVGVSLFWGLCWFGPGYRMPLICSLTWWSASPKQVRGWHLAVWEPSWFLSLMWNGDAMCRLGEWKWQSFASFWWFFLPGVSPASLQEFTLRSTLSASSLFSHLGISPHYWILNSL
jgi:hypothetical protein